MRSAEREKIRRLEGEKMKWRSGEKQKGRQTDKESIGYEGMEIGEEETYLSGRR